jgi:hypothetical protein
MFNFTWASVFGVTLIIAFYSLLPDIDHKNSTITWLFFGVGVLGLVITYSRTFNNSSCIHFFIGKYI